MSEPSCAIASGSRRLGRRRTAMLVGRDLERIFEFRREAIGDLIKR